MHGIHGMSYDKFGRVTPFRNGFKASYCFRGHKGIKYNENRETVVKWLYNEIAKVLASNESMRSIKEEDNGSFVFVQYYGSIEEKDNGSFQARFKFRGKEYCYSSSTYEKTKDWLDARNVEIVNGLNLTEVGRIGK